MKNFTHLMKFENFYLPPEDEELTEEELKDEEIEDEDNIEEVTPEGDDN